ncbi:MAG TPA: MFS transporter [Acetobacteraceae bacterium]|nr:MFS transporter [Acetobacteraceae bacterium]
MRLSAAQRQTWLLLAACFVTFSVGAACMHSYTVFLIAFIEAFGWTRAESSIAYSVSQMITGATSPLVGVMVDRLGPRRLVLIGGLLLSIGLLASSYANALWQVILLYGVVMTLGANCLGLVVFVPILSRRFVRHRGTAVAVVQSANGFARAFSAPVSQMLIDGLGWRGAYLAQGGFMAAAFLPLAAMFRTSGAGDPMTAGQAGLRSGWTLRLAARTPHFWLLFLVYVFTGLGSFLVALHQLAFAVTVGFDKLYAAEVLGLGAFLSLPGVIVTGWVSDYIGRELSAVVTYGTSIFGVACAMLITSPDQHLLLWLHSCFFGLTWGARGPAITAKTADLFPGPRLGTILGAITIGTGVGSAAGSWLAGWTFDMTGSYRVAFGLSIFFYVCGSVAFWLLRRPPSLMVVD